jgi:hypothetical protein
LMNWRGCLRDADRRRWQAGSIQAFFAVRRSILESADWFAIAWN